MSRSLSTLGAGDLVDRRMALLDLVALILDCNDAAALGAFYADATGGDITHAAPESAEVDLPDLRLVCRSVENDQPPTWPKTAVSILWHRDFWVDDLLAAEHQLAELGETTSAYQPPGPCRLVVMLDPTGHPFCICQRKP